MLCRGEGALAFGRLAKGVKKFVRSIAIVFGCCLVISVVAVAVVSGGGVLGVRVLAAVFVLRPLVVVVVVVF